LCDDAYQYAKDAPPHHQPAQVPVHESPHEGANLLLCQLFNTPAKVAVHLLTETRDTHALERREREVGEMREGWRGRGREKTGRESEVKYILQSLKHSLV